MFCTNCGHKLDDDALFCEQCGAKVSEEPNQEPVPPVAPSPAPGTPGKGSEVMEKLLRFIKENKKIVGIAAAIAVVLIAVIVFFATRPLTVHLDKYVTVEFDGCDTVGTAQISFDDDAFYDDYGEKIKYTGNDSSFDFWGGFSPCEMLLELCVDGSLDVSDGLTNGDTVVYQWDCDEETAKNQFGVRLSHKDITFTVEGLGEPDAVDPFADIELEFTGTVPDVKVNILKDSGRDYLYDLNFEVSPEEGLNNGDTITVSVIDGDTDELKVQLLERYGITLSQTSKTYTVDGLDAYVTSMDMISSDSLEKMKTQCNDVLTAELAKNLNDACTVKNITYMGNYLLTIKESNWYSDTNTLYLIYQIESAVTVPDKGIDETVTFYCPVGYRNVVVDSNGAVTNDLSNYMVTYDRFSKEIGDFWYYFTGYETLDDTFENCVTKKQDQYNYESTVEAE